MNYDLEHSDLSTVLAEGRLVADETKRVFGQLSAEQINWKPSASFSLSDGSPAISAQLALCRDEQRMAPPPSPLPLSKRASSS